MTDVAVPETTILDVPIDGMLMSYIKASQGKPLDERVAMLDGFTTETVMKWIQQVDVIQTVAGSTLYDMVYHLYTKVPSEKWTEALRAIAKATGRPYESLRKNFNKWLVRNDKELTPEHAERRERALEAVGDAGNLGDADADDDFNEWDDDIPVDDVLSVLQDEVMSEEEMDEYLDSQEEEPTEEKRTPLLVAREESARLKSEWINSKAETLGDSDYAAPAAAAAAEKLTSTATGGVAFDEWARGTIAAYEQSGYDEETSAAKAEVDWWKRQLKNHGFVEEAIKPDSVSTKPKREAKASKPKTKQAKLERAMEMVREVLVELKETGVVAEDRSLVGTCQSMAYTLKSLETFIKGETPQQEPKAPTTSKSAPADWTPPNI